MPLLFVFQTLSICNKFHCRFLQDADRFKIIVNNNVRHRIEDKLNVVRVRRTRQMRVNLLLVFSFVEILKLHANVAGRLHVAARSAVLGEANGER